MVKINGVTKSMGSDSIDYCSIAVLWIIARLPCCETGNQWSLTPLIPDPIDFACLMK